MKVDEYLAALTAAEMKERAQRRLPRDHALAMSEFPFLYAAEAFNDFIRDAIDTARRKPDDAVSHGLAGYANVLAGDYAAADANMERYSALNPGEPRGDMRFSKRIDRPLAILPPVVGEWPSKPSLFISCDPIYLKFYATPLLRSIAACAPGASVHLHLMGPAEPPTIPGITLTVTSEDPPPHISALEYFGAARLVRFSQALEASGVPLIMIDADALATGDPRPLLEHGTAAGLRVRAGRMEPWNHFSACVVRGTPQTLAYFRAVADIVLRSLERPFWGLDQYALFAAYLQEKPALALFGPEIASVVDDTPGLFWFTASKQKKTLGTSASPYAQLYRRYASGK